MCWVARKKLSIHPYSQLNQPFLPQMFATLKLLIVYTAFTIVWHVGSLNKNLNAGDAGNWSHLQTDWIENHKHCFDRAKTN